MARFSDRTHAHDSPCRIDNQSTVELNHSLPCVFQTKVATHSTRKLPRQQSTSHKLMLNYLLILPASAVLMVLEDAPWGAAILTHASGSALFILGYNVTVLLAYRQVDAKPVTSAEYTGLIWAVAIGWLMFGSRPTCGSWPAA